MHNAMCTKKIYIEFLRIISSFFVILNHINDTAVLYIPFSKTWFCGLVLVFISKIAVPIFLMISGSLLLKKQDSFQKYISRIIRLCFLILVFSILYYLLLVQPEQYSIKDFVYRLFNGITNAYWYLYLYIGILLVLPLLQKIAHSFSRHEIELLIFVTLFIGGIMPMVETFTGLTIKSDFYEGIFSPYLGMFFVGYYIDKYIFISKKILNISLIIFIILILGQVYFTSYFYGIDQHNYMLLDNRVFITITICSICIYIIVKKIFMTIKIPKSICKIICNFGSLSLGIYLFSDLIIYKTYWIFWKYAQNKNAGLCFLIYALLIFCLGCLSTAIIKKIPFIKNYI